MKIEPSALRRFLLSQRRSSVAGLDAGSLTPKPFIERIIAPSVAGTPRGVQPSNQYRGRTPIGYTGLPAMKRILALCGCLLASSRPRRVPDERPGLVQPASRGRGPVCWEKAKAKASPRRWRGQLQVPRRPSSVLARGQLDRPRAARNSSSKDYTPQNDENVVEGHFKSGKVFLKTDSGALLMKYGTDFRGKNGGVRDEMSVTLTEKNVGVKSLIDELKHSGVELKTLETPRKYYVHCLGELRQARLRAGSGLLPRRRRSRLPRKPCPSGAARKSAPSRRRHRPRRRSDQARRGLPPRWEPRSD